ncbi:MAG: hypothetical protein E7081_09390, partial [Bacteroidales bacterium]|nr:hypothetical protein [Bacteroidales bacterium]
MKKVVFLLFFLLPFLSFAENKSETHEIVIIKQDKKQQPRTPDFGSDITAYYQDGRASFIPITPAPSDPENPEHYALVLHGDHYCHKMPINEVITGS